MHSKKQPDKEGSFQEPERGTPTEPVSLKMKKRLRTIKTHQSIVGMVLPLGVRTRVVISLLALWEYP